MDVRSGLMTLKLQNSLVLDIVSDATARRLLALPEGSDYLFWLADLASSSEIDKLIEKGLI